MARGGSVPRAPNFPLSPASEQPAVKYEEASGKERVVKTITTCND